MKKRKLTFVNFNCKLQKLNTFHKRRKTIVAIPIYIMNEKGNTRDFACYLRLQISLTHRISE